MTSAYVIVDSSAYEGDSVLAVCQTEQEALAVLATWPDYVGGGAVREVPLVRLTFDGWPDEPKGGPEDGPAPEPCNCGHHRNFHGYGIGATRCHAIFCTCQRYTQRPTDPGFTPTDPDLQGHHLIVDEEPKAEAEALSVSLDRRYPNVGPGCD